METHPQAEPRVCILLESYYPVVGGMETQGRNLAGGLVRAGVSVMFVTRRTSRDLAPFEFVDNLPVFRLPPVTAGSRARWALVLTSMSVLFRRRRAYDVILVPGFRALGITAVIMGKLLGKASVLKAESCGEMSGEFFAAGLARLKLKNSAWPIRGLIALRNRLLARADALISLSSEMTEEFRQCGVPADRTHLIPQSVDVERFHPAGADEKIALRKKLGLSETDKLVIFSGRIVSYKGLPGLVEVWEQIAEIVPDARLVLVGAGGVDMYNCEAELRRTVAERRLQECVLFTGAVRNVSEYLQAADIFAFPTENEAFPLALLEAMACGLPVVATAVGGIKDVIQPDQNGLMIEPGNRTQLRVALEQLLHNPALAAKLGRAARQTVLDHYTRDQVTRQYLELFRQCRSQA